VSEAVRGLITPVVYAERTEGKLSGVKEIDSGDGWVLAATLNLTLKDELTFFSLVGACTNAAVSGFTARARLCEDGVAILEVSYGVPSAVPHGGCAADGVARIPTAGAHTYAIYVSTTYGTGRSVAGGAVIYYVP